MAHYAAQTTEQAERGRHGEQRRSRGEHCDHRGPVGSFGEGIGGAGAHGRSRGRLGDAAVGRERFAAEMPRPLTRASPGRAVMLLSTVMLLAIIVTTTCQLRTGVARDMRT